MHTKIRSVGKPGAWLGSEMSKSTEWLYELNAAQKREILDAFVTMQALGKDSLAMTKADFKLPTLGNTLRNLLKQAEVGVGVKLLRGLPIDQMTEAEVRQLYWGIGLHLGIVVPQARNGEFIGDVRNTGEKLEVSGRGYHSNDAIDFHTDSADLVMLLCRRKAKSGGASRLASSAAIHDHLLQTRPELLAELYKPMTIVNFSASDDTHFMHSRRWSTCPIFGRAPDGTFASRFQYIKYPVRFEAPADAPQLSDLQKEGIELIQSLANDSRFYFDMQFEAGDLQIVINRLAYHSRTSFEDHEEFDLRRHVLRMWVSTVTGPELPSGWLPSYGDVRAASLRGGNLDWRHEDRFGEYYIRAANSLGMEAPVARSRQLSGSMD